MRPRVGVVGCSCSGYLSGMSAGPPLPSDLRKSLLVAATLAVTGLLTVSCLALFIASIMHPRWWPVRWQLPDGTLVRFYKLEHSPPGRDEIKCLEVTPPGGPATIHRFAVWHAGYTFVELRANSDNSLIWLVDREAGRVGCSLDLRTGRFLDEADHQPLEVKTTSGHRVP